MDRFVIISTHHLIFYYFIGKLLKENTLTFKISMTQYVGILKH